MSWVESLLSALIGGVLSGAAMLLAQKLQWAHERELRAEERQHQREDRQRAEMVAMDRRCIDQVEAYCSMISDFAAAASTGRRDSEQLYLATTEHHFNALVAAKQLASERLAGAIVGISDAAAEVADEIHSGRWCSISSGPERIGLLHEHLTTAVNELLVIKLRLAKSL